MVMLVRVVTIIPHVFTISICSQDERTPQIITGALVLGQSLVSTQVTRSDSKECLCSAVSTCGNVRWYKIQLMSENPWETWRRRWYTLRSKKPNVECIYEEHASCHWSVASIFHSVHYRNTRDGKCKIRQCPTGKTTLLLNNIKERLCKTNASV